jgi:hypothetical protein
MNVRHANRLRGLFAALISIDPGEGIENFTEKEPFGPQENA